jgi:dihydropteroate synthase
MGILNLTPDSFYDGGFHLDPEEALRRALEMEAEGADIIDVGGESSRPGADEVALSVELERVLPVLEKLVGRLRVPISIDTRKAEVARRALEMGARVVNDITALRFDPGMMKVAAASSGPVVVMHMRGTPRDMQRDPRYRDVVGEIREFFRRQLDRLEEGGIRRERVILDPGIGFGKTLDHNLEIIAGLPRLADLQRPLLVGPSRKSFIGMITGRPPGERLWGTAAAAAALVFRGAHILRVHDPRQIKEVAAVADRILEKMEETPC